MLLHTWCIAPAVLQPSLFPIRANMTCLKSAIFTFVISLLRPFLFCGWVCDPKLSSFEGVEEPTGKKDNAPVPSKNQKATPDSLLLLSKLHLVQLGSMQLIVLFFRFANLYFPPSGTAYGHQLYLDNDTAVGCIKLVWPINTLKSDTVTEGFVILRPCFYSLLFLQMLLYIPYRLHIVS